jgi:ATP-dependent Clp protease ATP-binding subunit ClpA
MKTIKAFFKWSFIVIGSIVLIALVLGAFDDSSDESGARDMSEVEAAPPAVTEEDKKKDSIRTALAAKEKERRAKAKKELENKIATLKKNFVVQKDEFNDTEFYTHKNIGNNYPNFKTIYATLNNDGFIYLRSNYYADDWIGHERVSVKIGDKAKTNTESVPSYHKNNRTDNNSRNVWENVSYEQGQHIIEAVWRAKPSEKILVRFHGRKFYDDITLGPKSREALIQSYELSSAIKDLRLFE